MKSERAKVIVRGAVQGVGFRPFVYRLATGLHLKGWVSNSSQGVFIEAEGARKALDQFLSRLQHEKPPRAFIQSLEFSWLDAVGYGGFEILSSDCAGEKTTLILPDSATCADCLGEIFDPQDRRHLYPFTNCIHCGPRFSIIEALPYDRSNTSMKTFVMCSECDAEYHDPNNRRFHAQPNACPKCGPHLELWDELGNISAKQHEALLRTAEIIREGKIVAFKGIGGFQLIVDARNEVAVRRLRERKRREEKPFALMYPSLESIRRDCHISELESRLLFSAESPIVLLERGSGGSDLALSVAPHSSALGVMLPYTPLHHLLMRELNFPIVATSGNLANEPICTDEHEAFERLHDIADAFLVHDRPIVRHVDDSVARVMLNREMVLRRARGYAPLPVHLKSPATGILAVGAHLKNSVALGIGNDIMISQHIGDLETEQACVAFRKVIADFQRLYDVIPDITACDLHPDYLSSKIAQQSAKSFAVQHHYAHVLSCMAENELEAPVLGVAWDGTGYGTDGTIWGGEFLMINETSFERVAHFRQFRLPGGEASIRQPRRCALGVLYDILGDKVFARRDLMPIQHFNGSELTVLKQMLDKPVNAPVTSSVGRLFDAVASLVGLRQRASFEGQAAMELEFAIQRGIEDVYPFEVMGQGTAIVDWQPMMLALLAELQGGQAIGVIAAKFHNTLAEVIVSIAQKFGQAAIVLTGGCFQNKYLTERTVCRLQAEGFRPYWHQRVPPNDGGIALGQVMAAMRAVCPQAKAEEVCVP